MATTSAFLNGIDSPITPGGATDGLSSGKRTTNALNNKLSTVLSSSYADPEIRDALRLLDERRVPNDEDTRRDLKANAQMEVIKCNAMIVDDFGEVAQVCLLNSHSTHPRSFPQAHIPRPSGTNHLVIDSN